MIAGVGTDIIQISRIERAILSPNFLKRVFTEEEIKEYTEKGSKTETLAGKFAAKEAVSKCLKSGFSGFFPNEIEILGRGAPNVRLYGKAYEIAQKFKINIIHISISHDGDFAVAFAVAETENQ